MSPLVALRFRGAEEVRMQYSEELRAKVVERALVGESTQDDLAEEFGVSRSSIQNWMRRHRSSGATRLSGKDKRPQSWTREERLEAVLATHALSEEELGSWCRKRGIHTHHLGQWRQELVEGSVGKATEAGETRALRVENRALKKDLRRKEKALAETTALLVLKKKQPRSGGKSRTTDRSGGSRARVKIGYRGGAEHVNSLRHHVVEFSVEAPGRDRIAFCH